MIDPGDVEQYVKNPNRLIDLVREVIDKMNFQEDEEEIYKTEGQLLEISRTIERLEKKEIPVLDSLRAEKNRLAIDLANKAEAHQTLSNFADDLLEIVDYLKTRLNRGNLDSNKKRSKNNRTKSPRTSNAVLREHIISALVNLGGSARIGDVFTEMRKQLKGILLIEDMEWRENVSKRVWQINTNIERYRMVQEGILKADSPRGIWELTEEYNEVP